MERLIDANALSKKWQEMLDIKTGEKEEIAVYKIFEILIKRLSQEPTIDPVHAAGACYCWECRFADIGGNGVESWRYCKVKYRNIYPTDFCSYGQRREDTK